MSVADRFRGSLYRPAWLFHLSWLYLLLPWMLFLLGWLRPWVALSGATLVVLTFWNLWGGSPSVSPSIFNRGIWTGLVLLGLWVFLSGVGGYAFQNWDHHWRNAVFHDLIDYSWPVYYASGGKGPVQMLVYYMGYWLPAALIGKRLGWGVANLVLFLWTWLGVFLVGLHLSLRLRWPLWRVVLLLVFFSGADAIGTLLLPKGSYPSLWPPIQHLETWGENLQYSSFTTQLFWVFNQAVPAWLGTVLLMNRINHEQIFLAWALTFFFAPLPALGLLPFALLEWLERVRSSGSSFSQTLLKTFSLPNILAASIVLISFLYFSANTALQSRNWQNVPLAKLLLFLALEGGLLWMTLVWNHYRDLRWYLLGMMLLLFPFIQVGSGRDFVMRASIPALFYLMVWVAEALSSAHFSRLLRGFLFLLLGIGALTSLYEINRSIYRTFVYYATPHESERVTPDPQPILHLRLDTAPEADHPGTLVADRIRSLANVQDKLSKNFVANVRRSLFYRFLAEH